MSVVLLATLVSSAFACGGFFCFLQRPVLQTGEHILFSMKDGEVTSTIQIAYTGAAEDFSWVLPIPNTPTGFDVASDSVFRALHQFTDPTFVVNYNTTCPDRECRVFAGASAGFAPAADNGGQKVQVLLQGDVGPFTFIVIQAKEGDNNGEALFDWLVENKFQIPESAMPIVTRYVKLNYRFVTLKLQKGKAAGELVPIVIKYPAPSKVDMSCVPLRLTAIAATEMPIFVWIAADARAVVQNFLSLTPNLRRLPWNKCRSSFGSFGPFASSGACQTEYNDLLKKTASHFNTNKWLTTEYAGTISPALLDAIYNPVALPFDKAALAAKTKPQEFLAAVRQVLLPDLATSPVFIALLREFLPKPADVSSACSSDASFYALGGNCLDDVSFNAKAAAEAVENRLVAPTRRVREELSKFKYLTRFYGVFDPIAMVRDPIFRIVEGLGDVSNQHSVTMTFSCDQPKFDVTIKHDDGFSEVVSGVEVVNNSCGLRLNFPSDADAITVLPDDPIQTIEVLQADAAGKLVRKGVTRDTLASVDNELAKLDGEIMGAPTDANICNLGGNGCGCIAGSCGKGLKCELSKCRISDSASALAVSASAVVLMAALFA
jgi:hypothetical protein